MGKVDSSRTTCNGHARRESAPTEVDLTNCEREPIQIPGSIQPHGALLTLREPDLHILQASANAGQLLAIAAERELIDLPLAEVLEAEAITLLRAGLDVQRLDANPLHLLTLAARDERVALDVIAHRYDSLLVLEFEPAQDDPKTTPLAVYQQVRAAGDALQRAPTVAAFCQEAAAQVRGLTGFDRVMIYRFEEDDHGLVVAEARHDDLPPYLGLHYPASDIPAQARALYLRNRLRLIADAGYTPVPVLPAANPITGNALDMSYAVLRSVSPVHLQYLKNMGVAASMSISLVRDGRLWGLIACHHEEPRYVPFDVRAACEFVGQIVALQLGEKEREETHAERARLAEAQQRLAEYVEREPSNRFEVALADHPHDLLALFPGSGAAVAAEGTLQLLGQAPNESSVRALLDWLAAHEDGETFATAALPSLYAPAKEFAETASGLLAVTISKEQRSYLLWFRPEVLQTVEWAGDPEKPVEMTETGPRLSPRQSFESWQQTVRGTATPWRDWEIAAADELGRALRVVALRRAVGTLTRLNTELDAFAHMISHDMKEPLRGIRRYAQFLVEDYGETLDPPGREKLETLVLLSQRIQNQIDALLRAARIGRGEVLREDIDLNEVAVEQVELLSARLRSDGVTVRIPHPLPSLRADRVGVAEILQNLIANAIKYNDKPEKWIEIGAVQPGEATGNENAPNSGVILYVRDNGIGIDPEHHEVIFTMFRRLHERDAYGGGTGAGLAIARKMAERHGGRLWLDSTLGEGTTFYFTLQAPEAAPPSAPEHQ